VRLDGFEQLAAFQKPAAPLLVSAGKGAVILARAQRSIEPLARIADQPARTR
jgi:hypothetical protein